MYAYHLWIENNLVLYERDKFIAKTIMQSEYENLLITIFFNFGWLDMMVGENFEEWCYRGGRLLYCVATFLKIMTQFYSSAGYKI